MSYLENTPFSLVEVDSQTGEKLSPEAIENRKRLILLWKIQNEKQSALVSDLNDPLTQTEEALTGDEFIGILGNIYSWAINSAKFPILKMETLEKLAEVKAPTDPSTLN